MLLAMFETDSERRTLKRIVLFGILSPFGLRANITHAKQKKRIEMISNETMNEICDILFVEKLL